MQEHIHSLRELRAQIDQMKWLKEDTEFVSYLEPLNLVEDCCSRQASPIDLTELATRLSLICRPITPGEVRTSY